MKIIHCADLHIDCKNFSRFSPEKRTLKRHQMLQNFVDMVDYAEKNRVTAILLCGDVFESNKPLKSSLKVVRETILDHPNITFFYIWGNHDFGVQIFDKVPSNFVIFGNKFEKVDLGEVCVGGISFKRQTDVQSFDYIDFDKSDFNIMMMHGPVVADQYSDAIALKKMAGKQIDFLALGHIHKKEEGKIDKRGIWAYSGCLEAGKFGYTGDDYGFYVLDVKDGKMQRNFVQFAKYKYRSVEISVSNLKNSGEIFDEIEKNIKDFGLEDIVRIIFVGQRKEDEDLNKNIFIEKLKNRFFHLEIEDNTKIVFDLKSYANEKLSLKAEFVKKVFADKKLTEEDKQQICLIGLEALKGEDISI